jgi:two-component system, response regulator
LNHKYVLLAEDNPDDQRLTMLALRTVLPGVPIVVANDGQEALERLNEAGKPPPSLLLLDINMPRVNGLEVVAEVRKSATLWHVRVVMLTSSDEQGDIQRAYDRGANGYVCKPVQSDQFAEVVREMGLYWLGVNTGGVYA